MTSDAEHDERPHITTLGGLTGKQLAAVDLHVAGKSVTEVAEAVDADRTTVSKWINHNVEFRRQLRLRAAAVRDERRRTLETLTDKALDVVGQLLTDANPRIRLDAAKAVLAASASAEDPVDPYDPIALPGGGTGRYSGETEKIPVPTSLTAEERETVRGLLVALKRSVEQRRVAAPANGNGGRVVDAVQKTLPIPGPAVDDDVTTFD